ncbi:MAG TPA: tannase/feruloyl esterase family alpha/beta hydrolase, partial [Vicinamibacterales bacterium]|nr:tannase/feruloyl esterase family alpha/beta hydrolase [Vicinamibacterales bacterium]
EMVAEGPFVPATPAPQGRGRGGPAPAPQIVPAHCRIDAILRPSPDSEIEMEAWLPATVENSGVAGSGWNGKFQFVGGGGWAGVISLPAMVTALQDGYATASTDTGHKGGNALFAIDHPDKLIDFAYRAVHDSTVTTKALIAKYYGRAPRLSYWNGCSTGGRQGLMEAQKYPDDFDAVIAGAPANYQTHLHTWDLSVSVPVLNNPAEALSAAKLEMLNKAALAACDGNDGVKDGIINNPRVCKFDPAALLCKNGDAPDCLTAPQLQAVKRVYAPAKTKSGQYVFPGKEPGSETGWGGVLGGRIAPGVSVGSFQVAYNDANWDAKTFDLDRDLKIVDEKVGAPVNAINPDLSAFKAHGGKLLLYHGWNDTAISPGNTIDYYQSVVKKMGGKQDDLVRLFMAPGMQHCGGGPGPNQVNYMAVMERWREGGVAPASMEAVHVTNNRVDMTRPLCPYPQVATYKGTGSPNDASNFVCR